MTTPELPVSTNQPSEQAPAPIDRPSRSLSPDMVICIATGVNMPPRLEADLV